MLSALDSLQAMGRQVGVISHVDAIAERIGTQVRVLPTGTATSRVEVIPVVGVERVVGPRSVAVQPNSSRP